MHIEFVHIQNYRRLKSVRIDFGEEETIFVGANNSGKSSAIRALHTFLVSHNLLTVRDIYISHWAEIDKIGKQWIDGKGSDGDLNHLLPQLDLWLHAGTEDLHAVYEIVPDLNWVGGRIGLRLAFEVDGERRLREDFLQRCHANDALAQAAGDSPPDLNLWPKNLSDFLSKGLSRYLKVNMYPLDAAKLADDQAGTDTPQRRSDDAVPFTSPAVLKRLIRIDEIVAQRDFFDAGTEGRSTSYGASGRVPKGKLSEQLRTYFDNHLDPAVNPEQGDIELLKAVREAERSFDERLQEGFRDAFIELAGLGYPGLGSPEIKVATRLKATDGIDHDSAVQYEVLSGNDESAEPLRLPEDYLGLGYQNLIAIAFLLMSFRDKWMGVGKAGLGHSAEQTKHPPLLHLVIVEEPEAHLHAQVQQVFIKKAYELLRKHDRLGDATQFRTQLVVSTHSSHVAHETDFSNLRYFKREHGKLPLVAPRSTVVNLSEIFNKEKDQQEFVQRFLKATHCDLFFADAAILAEGQSEMILIPHFIRTQFSELSSRYLTLINVGGAYAHRFKDLLNALGIDVLVIADLDSVEQDSGKRAFPELGKKQLTSNGVLKKWHPQRECIDELAQWDGPHEGDFRNGGKYYVAFQKQLETKVIPRTFEDALILENVSVFRASSKQLSSTNLRKLLQEKDDPKDLAGAMHEWLDSDRKATFAMNCLEIEGLTTPTYIREGLLWLQKRLAPQLVKEGGQDEATELSKQS